MVKELKQFKVIIEQDGDGYFTASVPVLPGCHTQAKTLTELKKRVQDAIVLCLDVAKTDASYRKIVNQFSYEPAFVGLETVSA